MSITGNIQAASVQQAIDWLGESFTIRNQLTSQYSATTTEALPDGSYFTAKGIFDNRMDSGGSGYDVRGEEKAIIIGTKTTDGVALPFIPGIGDLVDSGDLSSSIRRVDELRGSQGVTTFYRLVMENA